MTWRLESPAWFQLLFFSIFFFQKAGTVYLNSHKLITRCYSWGKGACFLDLIQSTNHSRCRMPVECESRCPFDCKLCCMDRWVTSPFGWMSQRRYALSCFSIQLHCLCTGLLLLGAFPHLVTTGPAHLHATRIVLFCRWTETAGEQWNQRQSYHYEGGQMQMPQVPCWWSGKGEATSWVTSHRDEPGEQCLPSPPFLASHGAWHGTGLW